MKQLQNNTSIFLFIVLTTVLIIVTFLSYTRLKHFEASTNAVVHTSIIKNNLTEILSNLINAETGQRGYLLTEDTIFLDSYKGAEQHINLLLNALDTLIQDNEIDQKELKIFKQLIEARLLLLDNNLTLFQGHPEKLVSGVALLKGKKKMDEVRRHADIMLHMADRVMLQRVKFKDRSASVTPFFLLTLSLFSIFFLTLFFFRLQKETSTRISSQQMVVTQEAFNKEIKESEERFSAAVTAVEGILWTNNAKGEMEGEQAGWAALTGQSYEEYQGYGWTLGIHPNDVQPTIDAWNKALFERRIFNFEHRLKMSNGQWGHFSVKAVPLLATDGLIREWVGVHTNITQRKIAEKTLKESEEKFRGLAESLPHLVWITDEKGEPLYASEKWREYSGLNPYETGNWQLVVHPDDLETMTKAWTASLVTKKRYYAETRLKHKQGYYRWHVVEGVPLKNADEKIIKWIGAFTDIHEQKIKEQQKDDFISIASHEMKTPLATAKGYIDLLQLSLGEENQTALFASKANQALAKLNDLVTELLDASKIQNGQLNYTITTFDFNKIVDETIENFQLTVTNHTLQRTGNCSKQLNGDKGRLQQVLINLLSNAIKYSPNADKVLVRMEEQESKIQVSVQDFGIGMSGQHLDKIFDRYYRVQEHAISFQGLGIGLYISNNIIKRHNGTMWAESEPDKGSTFYFTLPI